MCVCVCVYLVQVLPGGLLVYGFISLLFVFICASLSLPLSLPFCRCFLRHGFAAIIKRHKEGEQQNETKSAAQHSSKMKSKTKSHIRYERAQHKCQVLTSCSLSLRSLSPSSSLSVPRFVTLFTWLDFYTAPAICTRRLLFLQRQGKRERWRERAKRRQSASHTK